MRLDEANLAILIEHTERITFNAIDDTYSLLAGPIISIGLLASLGHLLELDKIMKFVVANDVRPRSDFCGCTKVLREHFNLQVRLGN